jgi:hypothetical protein
MACRAPSLLLAALVAAGGAASAEEMIGPRIGTLDCRFSVSVGSIVTRPPMRCTIFPAPPGRAPRTLFTGRLGGPPVVGGVAKAPALPQQRGRAVWYVTATERLLNLRGEYVRATSGRERLVGGTAGSTRLYPVPDVPNEDLGPNFALGASGLTLQ